MNKLDIINFILENTVLCISIVILIIIYIIFECYQIKLNKKYISIKESIYLYNKNQGIIIDIRAKKEYESKHIPGAINCQIENEQLIHKIKKKYNKYNIIVYCNNTSKDNKAYKFVKKFRQHATYILKGGIEQWHSNGLPINFNDNEN